MGDAALSIPVTLDRGAFTAADTANGITLDTLTRPEANSVREAVVKALDESPSFRGEVRTLIEKLDADRELVDLVEADAVPIAEAAVARDGTALVKLISPGWGSSGYYSRKVIERDIPKAFPAGTKQFWNHPTATEARERPEGDLDRLAAEIIETPTYLADGPAGEGAYARVKVFERYRAAVDDLGPHIGLSIRGRGAKHNGTAEGRSGPIIDEVTEGESVDFVTLPGRGGEIVQLFESAGRRPDNDHEGEGGNMEELAEARRRAEEAEAKITEAETRAREADERAKRAELAVAVTKAGTVIAEAIADEKIPDVAKARIAERLAENPPLTEAGELDDAKLAEAAKADAKAEAEYLGRIVGSGRVTGLGESHAPDADAEADKALDEAWSGLADAMHLPKTVSEAFVSGR